MLHDSSGAGDKSRTGLERTLQSNALLEVESCGKFQIQQVATVGRAPGSDVVLSESSVSRNHARIFYEGGHYWIKDLDSANGTMLNGKRIRLQMLGDGDKIAFGEAKAVFYVSGTTTGPAPIANDPLEGTEATFEDGTPTGGLLSKHATAEEVRIRQLEHELAGMRKEAASRRQETAELLQRMESLQQENERLRAQRTQNDGVEAGTARASSSPILRESSDQEIERLRRLVKQLERALADNNIRLRNLQERLDRGHN
jgi:pSer/pThr/pTyr-binding forkhead associated (FHA) protein